MASNLIVIGVSTGGPKLLNWMFSQLPPLNAAIVIIQHVPPDIDRAIVERLNRLSSMEVYLAESGDILREAHVYLAPALLHLTVVANRSLQLVNSAKVNFCCPSIDVTMKSLKPRHEGKTIGVILTGMGKDGAEGLVHIKGLGGITLAQSEESCTIFGMPKYAIDTGMVDYVLDPALICKKLQELVGVHKP